jgi:GNAT superfamily N-acetyltransferase
MSKYEIRRYAPADIPGVLQLFADVWGDEVGVELRQLWDWKYDANPASPAAGPHVYVVVHQREEIVGAFAAMSSRVQVNGSEYPNIWGMDFATHPRHRGRGVRLLRSSLQAMTEVVQLGMPPDGRPHDLDLRVGCQDVARMQRYRLLLDPRPALAAKGVPALLHLPAAWACTVWNRLCRSRAGRGADGIEVRDCTTIDTRFDALWRTVSAGYEAATVRDATFMQWRFRDCPTRNYTILEGLRQGELAGYLVCRDEDSSGFKRGRIVDFLTAHDDPALLRQLVAAAVSRLRERGAATVVCTIAPPADTHLQALQANGFLRAAPACWVVRGIAGKVLDKLDAVDRWFLTAADSDIDLFQ